MNNEELRSLIRDSEVASQIVDKLPSLPDGVQTIIVKKGEQEKEIRIVRLKRDGNKLRRS